MTDGVQEPQGTNTQVDAPLFAPEPGAVIGGRYRVDRLIAEGGMATVFLAEDLKHGRPVAVKVLHESLANTIGVQRFLREIEVIARLQHPHLLTLIDSGTVGHLPYYVMPFIEAQSLRELIDGRERLTIADAITIAREVADGLSFAHQHGVVHRDIKPSNILMSGGHAVVADFGIATAVKRATVARLTMTGISLGSPTYMSPEQAAGEHDVDERSDVYSVACVLYEMLAGRPPAEHTSMQQVVTSKLTGAYTGLRTLRPDVPVKLEEVIHRALEPDREARWGTIAEFSGAIAAAVPSGQAVSRRMKWALAGITSIVVVGGVAWQQHQQRIVWATQQVPTIERLARESKFAAAFQLAEQVLPIIPDDSALRRLRPSFTDFVRIVTVPPGAQVSIQALGARDTTWKRVGTTPLLGLPIAKWGNDSGYRVRVSREGYRPVDALLPLFTEVRFIGGSDALDTLHLDPRDDDNEGMVRVRGWSVQGSSERAGYTLADYHIGRFEVTNREYEAFVAAGGYRRPEFWTVPMQREGRQLEWAEGVASLVDRTGRPGPSTWSSGRPPAGEENFPVGGVSYYEAAAYAKFAGKQLPTSAHWARAAQHLRASAGWIYMPSSNIERTKPRAVGEGQISVYGLYDVAGNMREWCVNLVDDGRLTRGGGYEDAGFMTSHLIARPEFDRSPSNGIRLVSLTDADSTIQRLSGRIERNRPLDFRAFRPVSDEQFAVFRGMYQYDARALDAKDEGEGVFQDYHWQKVSFSAAYGQERMAAYLFIPRHANGPYEAVIYWPPGNAPSDRRLDPASLFLSTLVGFIPKSGRVLVLPLYKGTFERKDSTFGATRYLPDTTTYYRDMMIAWTKDLRRTIDYLETRADIHRDRIGYYGLSWGGATAPIALAVEPRIKAAVLNSAGYFVSSSVLPEVSQANYAPRVKIPTLMLNGQYDTNFPFETSQKPFFDALGTPARDKRQVVLPRSHILPRDDAVREALAWFDRYLSGRAPEAAPH